MEKDRINGKRWLTESEENKGGVQITRESG